MLKIKSLCVVIFQNKYKESGKKSRTSSLYSQLPQTNETQFNKTLSEIQSQVILHVLVKSELSFCLWLKVLIFCLCFRLNIKKPAGRTRRLLCTQNFLRLWTRHTSKKRHSCRVRYETTVTHIQVKPWGLGLIPSPIHRSIEKTSNCGPQGHRCSTAASCGHFVSLKKIWLDFHCWHK